MTTPNVGFAIFNGLWPLHGDAEHGPRALRIALDYNAAALATQEVNLTEDEMMVQLKFVQGVYIDNADNGAALTMTVQLTQQRIKVKANTQGFFPIFAPGTAKFSFTSTPAGTLLIPVHFVNVPLPWGHWATV